MRRLVKLIYLHHRTPLMASTKPKSLVLTVVRKVISKESAHSQHNKVIEIHSTLITKTDKPKIRYLTKVLISQAFNHSKTTKTDKIPNKITMLDNPQHKTKHNRIQTEQSFPSLHQTHKPKPRIQIKLW